MFIKTDGTWGVTDIYPFATDEKSAAWTWRVSVSAEGVILVSDSPNLTPQGSIEIAKNKIAAYQKAIEIAESIRARETLETNKGDGQ